MRKILSLFCAISIYLVNTQASMDLSYANRLFHEGQTMFRDENFAGCIEKIHLYKIFSLKEELVDHEADFLLVASTFYLKSPAALHVLINFLKIYPQTHHKNEVCFMIGSICFDKKEYHEAENWFNQCDMDILSFAEQEKYIYFEGIINTKKGNYETASRFFSVLNHQYGSKYKTASEYYMAYIDYIKGDYNQALNGFISLKKHPIFGQDALRHIIHVYFHYKKYGEVIEEGEILLKKDADNPENTPVKKMIGAAYFYKHNYSKAIDYLQSVYNKSDQEYALLGLSYYQLRNYESAIDYLNRSNLVHDSVGQSIYLYLGQAYLQEKDSIKAIRSFESASRMNFNYEAKEIATYNYAVLLYQNAINEFGELISIMENFMNTYPHSIYREKISRALINVYLTTQNYDVVLASIEKIKSPGEKLLEAKQKIYYHLGITAFANSNYDLSIDYFNHAIEMGSYAIQEKNLAIYWRGEAQYRQEKYILAAKDFQSYKETANKTVPWDVLVEYNLGYCYFKQAQYDKAIPFFESFIRKETNQDLLLDSYSRLGDCYFSNHHFDQAEIAYDQAIKIFPEANDYILFQKGCTLGMQKNYNGKVEQLDRLIKKFPNSHYLVDALYEKGRAYILKNQPKEAIKIYESLLLNYPDSRLALEARLQLGLLYYNNNQLKEAIEAYKYLISHYPNIYEAKESLQDLKTIYLEINDMSSYMEYTKSLGDLVHFEVGEQDSLTYLTAERLFFKGDTLLARNALKDYLQAFPEGTFRINTHYYLANIYYQQKDYDEAKQAYDQVINAGNTPFLEEAIGRTAEIQYQDKEYSEAFQSYKKLKSITKSKTNFNIGILGMMRSAYQLNSYQEILDAAEILLDDKTMVPETITEAKFYRAKSYIALGDREKAESDLTNLSADTKTAYGSEACYLLAQLYFDKGNLKEAQKIIQKYIQQNKAHSYWLAMSFILLSDIYVSKKDFLKARQYLESLQINYKNKEDGIQEIIKERLRKI